MVTNSEISSISEWKATERLQWVCPITGYKSSGPAVHAGGGGLQVFRNGGKSIQTAKNSIEIKTEVLRDFYFVLNHAICPQSYNE